MRLRLVPKDTNWNFFAKPTLSLGISGLLVVASILSFLVIGLNFGIDFRGGTTIRTEANHPIDVGEYRAAIDPLSLGDVSITEVFDPSFGADKHVTMIRIQAQEGQEAVTGEVVDAVEAALLAVDPTLSFPSVESVGPKVSGELIQSAVISVLLAIAAVLFYIWLRFEWQFSLGAVAALVHDIILTIGIFSVLQIRFDLAIIAALLTIVGYSLNDTVVVFDRVRENLRKYKQRPLKEVMTVRLSVDLALRAGRRCDPRLCLRNDLGRRGRHLFLNLRGIEHPADAGRQARLVETGRQRGQPIRQY